MSRTAADAIRRLLTDALLPCPLIHAAALYGSAARGDAEAYSDLDVLAVCDASRKRETLEQLNAALSDQFEKTSVSLYTPRELLFLAKQRSLFLLHLNRESLILFDRTGYFTHVLATFEPKNSYSGDFEQSLNLLRPLMSSIIGASNHLHRLAYVYSLFRVFGVYLLAENEIFEFSKAKMVTSLCIKYPALQSEIAILSSLRVLNSNFFGGSCAPPHLVDHGNLLQISIQALGSLCGQSINVIDSTYDQAVTKFVEICRTQSRRLGYKLRTWFLILLYDGLNLYCAENGIPQLMAFTETGLLGFVESEMPSEIRNAASVGIDYLRNYPLRYFLLERSKIPIDQACNALEGIVKSLCASRLFVDQPMEYTRSST
jgi:predicted nucleotidyltransferase